MGNKIGRLFMFGPLIIPDDVSYYDELPKTQMLFRPQQVSSIPFSKLRTTVVVPLTPLWYYFPWSVPHHALLTQLTDGRTMIAIWFYPIRATLPLLIRDVGSSHTKGDHHDRLDICHPISAPHLYTFILTHIPGYAVIDHGPLGNWISFPIRIWTRIYMQLNLYWCIVYL